MCGNPFRIIQNLFSAPRPKAQTINIEGGTDPKTLEEIRRERELLSDQRSQFMDAQQQFQEDQARFIQESRQISAAPAISPEVQRRQPAPLTASEVEQGIASRRRGRRSLRIPLGSSQAGAGGTGLNVPRG